jgi:hypothetical protein
MVYFGNELATFGYVLGVPIPEKFLFSENFKLINQKVKTFYSEHQ